MEMIPILLTFAINSQLATVLHYRTFDQSDYIVSPIFSPIRLLNEVQSASTKRPTESAINFNPGNREF